MLDADALYGVCSTIEATMAEGGAPQDARARLAAALGDETLGMVAQFAKPDDVIASVAKAPATKNSLLNSSKGRKFIRELWSILLPAAPTEASP